MKTLCIIVPKDSQINSFLMNHFSAYDQIPDLSDRVCYKQIGLSHPMDTINYLISMFMLCDFSINCNYGEYIFRVRS